ncbi:MAG: hypothetical protein WCA28_04885 [Bradyrhizobium sp.]
MPFVAQIVGTGILTQNDPTDNALAAIASILDQPESHRGPEKPAADEVSIAPEPGAPDGYSRVGPGPMAAIRFKWTARLADDGYYYVEETIGETIAPVVTGPMSGEAAVRFVDECESEARRRFEAIRSEMAGRSAAASLVRKDSDI